MYTSLMIRRCPDPLPSLQSGQATFYSPDGQCFLADNLPAGWSVSVNSNNQITVIR